MGARAQMNPPSREDEDGAEAEEQDSFGSLPTRLGSASLSGSSSRPFGNRPKNLARDDWTPLTAEGCFEEALEVDVEYPVKDAPGGDQGPSGKGTFRVYYTSPAVKSDSGKSTGTRAPAAAQGVPTPASEADLMNLQPADIADDDEGPEKIASYSGPSGGDPGTVFFLIHGAGFSALSWALLAREITKLSNGEAGVLAMDCRGHGEHHLQALFSRMVLMSKYA